MSNILDQIHIVLVRPQHAGNIGSVARAMKNMGLSHLILVHPPDEWFESAKIMAANSVDILKRAHVVDSLSQGTGESIHVVGTTRRGGEGRSPARLSQATAKRILKKAEKGVVSVLFGNERVGLSDDELSNCHENIVVSTSPNQPSLNLSHSVLLVAYELFRNSSSSKFSVIQKNKDKYLAREKDLDEMCRLIEPALVKLGYSNAKKRLHLGLLIKTIKRTAKRSEFEIRDVRMIEGIARRIIDRLAG